MHTLISLEDGVLNVELQGEAGAEVDRVAWYGAIRPAIALLTAWGGGEILLPHHPGDLAA